MKSEDITTISEEKRVTEEDRNRFLERYCAHDSEKNLSLEFVTLEATVKAQTGMLKVQDLHSDVATHTKEIVTTTIHTIKEEITTAIAKGPVVFQKKL